MQNILLVEDDLQAVKAIKIHLQNSQFLVFDRNNGESAWEFIKNHKHQLNLIVIDIGLPRLNGLSLCQRIRDFGITLPILFLSGELSEMSIIKAFEYGADDYLTKPFSLAILKAKIQAQLRRPALFTTKKLVVGKLEVSLEDNNVFWDASPLNLRKKEQEVLRLLAVNKNQAVTRDFILDHVWQDSQNLTTNTVDVCIKGLRQKLGSESTKLIQTVHGVGYRLNATS